MTVGGGGTMLSSLTMTRWAMSCVMVGVSHADFIDCDQVGYAMCLKADTPLLSSLVEVVDRGELPSSYNSWVTDLVLALLLQGAQLQSLATGDDETCYHTAVYLCCFTGG